MADAQAPASGAGPEEEDASMQTKIRRLASMIGDTQSLLAVDGLLDSLIALQRECSAAGLRHQTPVADFLRKFAGPVASIKDLRINKDHFTMVKVIGRGAFGEVQLVKHKQSGETFALKKLSKCEMLKRSDAAFFWEERDIMSHAKSPWIVALHYAFQDDQYLYLAMEFMAGGDLVTLLENHDFPEHWARFYIAELILALEAVHSLGYIHRDVKPDNLLVDAQGHVKLADFGTCIKMNERGLVKVAGKGAVGTPDYISPEVLKSQDGHGEYGRECDWWAVGVCLFELLCGDTPFYSESLLGTYSQIMNHKPGDLKFPEDVTLSADVKDLLQKLLSPREDRLGSGPNGVQDIKDHRFFKDVDWESIRDLPPPVVPKVSSQTDTSNFPEVESPDQPVEVFKTERSFTGNQLPFIGFTYTREKIIHVAAEADTEHSPTRRDSKMSSSDHAEVRAEFKSLAADKEKLQAALEAVKAERDEAVAELAESRDTMSSLQHALKDAKDTQEIDRKRSDSTRDKDFAMLQLQVSEQERAIETMREEGRRKEAGWKEAVAEVEAQCQELQRELSHSAKKLSRASEERAELDSDNERLRTALKAEKQETLMLRRSSAASVEPLADNSAEVDELQAQLAALRKSKEAADTLLEEAEAASMLAARKAKRAEEQVAESEAALAGARREMARAKADLATEVEQGEALRHQMELLEDQKVARDKELRGIRTMLGELQVDLESARAVERAEDAKRDALATTKQEVAQRDDDIHRLEEKLGAMGERLKAQMQEKTQVQDALDTAEDRVAQLQVDLKKAELRIAAARRDEEEEERERGEAAARIKEQLNATITRLEDELEDARVSNGKLTKRLEASEAAAGDLEARLADQAQAQPGVDRLSAELHESREAVEEARLKLRSLTSQNGSQADDLAAAQAKLAAAEEKRATAEERLAAAQAERAQLQAQLEEQRQEYSQLAHTCETQRIDMDKLTKDVALEKESLAMLEASVQAREATIKELQEKARAELNASQQETRDATAAKEAAEAAREKVELTLTEHAAETETLSAKVVSLTAEVKKQKIVTAEAVNKVETLVLAQLQMAAPVKQKKNKIGELETQIRKLKKQVKSSQANEAKLEHTLTSTLENHSLRLREASEDFGRQISHVQKEAQLRLEDNDKIVEAKERELEETRLELHKMKELVFRIQNDESLQRTESKQLRKHLSGCLEVHEGWVDVPDRSQQKKNSWVKRYAVMTANSLSLYHDETKGEAVLMLYLWDVGQVRPASPEDYIHAKPNQVSRLFLLLSHSDNAASRASNSISLDRHSSSSSTSSSTPMRTLKGLRKAMKAMRSSQAKVETIAQEALAAGLDTHFFMAPTEADQRAWVKRLSYQMTKCERASAPEKRESDASSASFRQSFGSQSQQQQQQQQRTSDGSFGTARGSAQLRGDPYSQEEGEYLEVLDEADASGGEAPGSPGVVQREGSASSLLASHGDMEGSTRPSRFSSAAGSTRSVASKHNAPCTAAQSLTPPRTHALQTSLV